MTKPEDAKVPAVGSLLERLVGRLVPEAEKALWAKCSVCLHCWPAAYYPIDMARMAQVLKGVACPRGCASPPLLAKQEDGVLLEESL